MHFTEPEDSRSSSQQLPTLSYI